MKRIFIILFLITDLTYAQSKLNLSKYDPQKTYTQGFIDSLGYDKASGEAKWKGEVDIREFKKVLDHNLDLKGWVYYYGAMSDALFREQKLDSALYFANKGVNYYNQLEVKRPLDVHLSAICYRFKGLLLQRKKEYDAAIENYQKALDIYKKHPYKWKTFVTSYIADCHLDSGNNDIALQYYLKCTKDSLFMSLARPAVSTCTRIGVLYDYLHEPEKAKKYFKQGIVVSQKFKFTENLWVLFDNMGDLHREAGNIDSTLYYFKKSIKNYVPNNSYPEIGRKNVEALKAYIDLHSNRIDKGIKRVKKIIDSYERQEIINLEDKELVMFAYEILVEAYTKKNDTENLNKLIVASNIFLENYYKNQSKKQINNLELKYQTKEKDNFITQLEETTQNQKVIIKQRNTINWILIGLLLSFFGLGILFYRQKQLKNKYIASNLEQRLLRSQLNPHFLFNALNSVSGLVQKKSEKTIPYISKLGHLLRSILENSREEFISLEEELEINTTYLELQSNFSKKFQYTIEVNNTIDKDAILIPPMFIQPFIENSIEHGFQNEKMNRIRIMVNVNKLNKTLDIEIEDNGIGLSKSTKIKGYKFRNQSLSGKILQERLLLYAKEFKLKAFYKIENLDKGTKVNLHLPYLLDR